MTIQIVKKNEKDYPRLFYDYPRAPKELYCAGDITIPNYYPCVAIVGTRNPTEASNQRSYDLAALLASRGYGIVSGLAYNTDTYAHYGALSVPGGKTIAVLGTSLSKAYPPENKDLQERIGKEGLLITEYKYDKFDPHRFRYRDYLQAALCIAVIAMQAGKTSGTIHSLRAAFAFDRLRFFETTEINSAPDNYGALRKLTREEGIPITKFRIDEVDQKVIPLLEKVVERKKKR